MVIPTTTAVATNISVPTTIMAMSSLISLLVMITRYFPGSIFLMPPCAFREHSAMDNNP
ncbi:hypothetical protein E3G69_000298 [Mycobacteroides abscessus]|nr:hypothetical protein [Mycobacteroides abscessus]QOF41283.1 hypothetical protein E3G69_000298 [Mycobacteroides abscessus]